MINTICISAGICVAVSVVKYLLPMTVNNSRKRSTSCLLLNQLVQNCVEETLEIHFH